MPKFNIARACDLVEGRFGEEQRAAADGSIQSVVKRLNYARFHHRQITDLLARFQAARLDASSLFEVAFGPDQAVRDEYYEFMDAIGAHAVACAQSIHSVADLLANAVFYCLKLDAGGEPLAPEKVDLRRVCAMLGKEPALLPIKAALETLVADAAFAHVDALSNKAKHSSLVKAALNEDMTGERERRHEIRFQAFRRKGADYPEAEVEGALAPAYRAASEATIGVGILLVETLER